MLFKTPSARDVTGWLLLLQCLVTESANMLQPVSDAVVAPQHNDHYKKPEDRTSETDVTVYGFVGVDTWSPNTATATILQDPVV
jgi:hypothetical protein